METHVVQETSLKKSLSLPQIIALYIGAVLGSGILLIPGMAADLAGPASMISWVVMSILVVPMAITMGLLSARYPSSGGVSHFVRLSFGDRLGNLVGWFFLLSVPIGAPILAITGSNYFAIMLGFGETEVFLLAISIIAFVIAMNYFGMQVAGNIQSLIVSLIIAILLVAIISAIPHASVQSLTPFAPHGWFSVFQATGLLFWCFIGWEAVTHLSGEFKKPRNAIRGVLWSVGIISLLYLSVAFLTIATKSYGTGISEASLSQMIQLTLGPIGGWIVAVAALFICLATANAYIGAAARIAYALSQANSAPKWLGALHSKYQTPIGGLQFLMLCMTVTFSLLYFDVIGLSDLIQLPNAMFMATYIGGCIAGAKLMRDDRLGRTVSLVSLVVTLSIYPSLGWAALLPVLLVVLQFFWKK